MKLDSSWLTSDAALMRHLGGPTFLEFFRYYAHRGEPLRAVETIRGYNAEHNNETTE